MSIESLFHAGRLETTIPHLRAALATGGALAIVEDMRPSGGTDPIDGSDEAALRRLWSTPRLHTASDYREALRAAGLRIECDLDLTDQVPFRDAAALEQAERRVARWRRVALRKVWRRVLDAFAGGFVLERLYAARRMEYRCIIARAS